MMRTIEVLIVIIIIGGAFVAASAYAVLPWPREVSPVNLRRLSYTTLMSLDASYDLSEAAFDVENPAAWSSLQTALSASLPPNVLYNLTVYDVGNSSTTELYTALQTISNAKDLGSTSDAFSYTVASSSVTFNMVPEKIGGVGGGTLYILNCSDANGWWTTGYTAQGLAADLFKLLSPFFEKTVLVQNTTQLGKLLNGISLEGEPLRNSIIINTFGEAVPIPDSYSTEGYYAPRDSYNLYFYSLGQKTREYNWTWASIVGYPMYYVTNTGLFPTEQNDWGIYGMKQVGSAGFNAFLRGLSEIAYNATWYDGSQSKTAWWWQDSQKSWVYDHGSIDGSISSAFLSADTLYYSNYYGIYPAIYQTATRALPSWITSTYGLTVTTALYNPENNYQAGAVYRAGTSGGFLALGLTRTPDIRLTALGILSDYKPQLYRSEYTAYGTSRLVILQLGLIGGV